MNPLLTRTLPRSSLRGVSAVESSFTARLSPQTSPAPSPSLGTPSPSTIRRPTSSKQWQCGCSRLFSTSTPTHSRIGGAPVTVPKSVQLKIFELTETAKAGRARGAEIPKQGVEVQGPLGTMSMTVPSFSRITFDEKTRKVVFAVQDAQDKHQRAMWGTVRALFASNVIGVSEGHICILRLVGVGFRATVEDVQTGTLTGLTPQFPGQKFINLKVGYAHPIELACPAGVEASTPQPTMILLQGVDKQKVKQFAAEIREWRVPEPYKGKGIFIDAETIKMKAKKIK